ncbi:MAG: 3'-5' exoribonuclease YhaM family protein [Thermodesulfobacteriota bacterium]
MKKRFIDQLQSGETVDDVFVLSEKTMGHKRDGDPYLSVVLSDKTGRMRGVVWDGVGEIAPMIDAGDFVHIRGSVSEYRGMMQIVVKAMAVEKDRDIAPSDFLPASRRNPEKMFSRLQTLCRSIETDCLRALIERFWADDAFVRAFKTAPAAKLMHHAYIGGLLEHSLSLALLVDRVADHYAGIDRDMLMAGAVLHDIGKIREFEFNSRIDYSDEGRLINHIVIGVQMMEEKIAEIEAFPEQTALLLKHLIVSHHGSREFGSPEPPKTLDAVLLNYLDEIDSKVNGVREFINNQDPGSQWTGYHKPLERFFYKGRPDNDNSG